MTAITSQWWHRLVNAYEVKVGMVCLQCNKKDGYSQRQCVSFNVVFSVLHYLLLSLNKTRRMANANKTCVSGKN